MKRRTFFKTAAGAAALSSPAIRRAAAPSATTRHKTLISVQEYGPNSMDMQGIGAAQPVNGVSLNCYDTLIRFRRVPFADGIMTHDLKAYDPALATEWETASDGMSCTFKLRKDAVFYSKRPVTAKDVKWSMDRAVTIGGFATTQMAAGSLEKPEQFVAVDDKTFRIDFARRDKLTMPDLAVAIPMVYDSETAIANSGGDPLAKEYLKNNVAGSGAYKVESWKP